MHHRRTNLRDGTGYVATEPPQGCHRSNARGCGQRACAPAVKLACGGKSRMPRGRTAMHSCNKSARLPAPDAPARRESASTTQPRRRSATGAAPRLRRRRHPRGLAASRHDVRFEWTNTKTSNSPTICDDSRRFVDDLTIVGGQFCNQRRLALLL